MSLAIVSTHPIQYNSPVFRIVQQRFGIPVTAIYGSDCGVVGYHDKDFGATFAWDVDLLGGYTSIFLSRVNEGGARSSADVTTSGLDKALKRVAPKAVLLLGHFPVFYTASFYETWKNRYPIILRSEANDFSHYRGFLKNLVRDSFLRWMYKKCARILYVGSASYQHFIRLGCPSDKLIFSPYCVDTRYFRLDDDSHNTLRSEARKGLGIAESKIVIIFSGKLTNKKRPDLILQALQELGPETQRKVTVLYMGDGALRAKLEEAASKLPLVNVIFVGFQNQSQIDNYYHASDMLILPSQATETWGLVVNEALHHGIPCVVSRAVGSGPDLVEPGATGEVFEINSAENLAGAIQRALQLVKREDIRDKCLFKISHYTVEKAAGAIAKAYGEVARQ